MTSNPIATHSPNRVHTAGMPPLLRLQLAPNEPDLDGAFWPQSRELSTELPALLAAMSVDLGPITLIGYHRDAWNPSPDRIMLADRDVHLVGFVSDSPPTMVVIADSGRSVTLRVLPPDTDAGTAAAVMSVATHRAAESYGDRQSGQAASAETRSLEELISRLARLPANSGPGRAALISRLVAEAAEQFSDAPVQVFVPILVEHIVRGQLQKATHT